MAEPSDSRYVLYYWPGLPGRGEYVRLLLEDAGVPYEDVAQGPDAMEQMTAVLDGERGGALPFAPPILEADGLLVSQTATILDFLADRFGALPQDEGARWACRQVQLTIADFVMEIHDTHHPLGPTLYYEDQKAEAKRRAEVFRKHRMPKFLGYFERLADRNGGTLVEGGVTYADLSMFQTLEGLVFALPNAVERTKSDIPKLLALRDAIAERPGIASYLASDRRQAFNEHGLFRRYPELDPA